MEVKATGKEQGTKDSNRTSTPRNTETIQRREEDADDTKRKQQKNHKNQTIIKFTKQRLYFYVSQIYGIAL